MATLTEGKTMGMKLPPDVVRKCLELADQKPKPASVGIQTMDIYGWHPAKLNDLMGHWARAAKLKKADREKIAVAAVTQGIAPATGKRKVHLKIVLKPSQRGGDVDAYWKSTLDALVAVGLLKDDSRQWCELAPAEFERSSIEKTVITLTDIEGE